MNLRRLAALVCLAALTGCVSAAHRRDADANRLVITGLAGEPDSLNPLLSSAADVYDFSHLYLSYLVESNAKGQLIPEIAERVPTQQNGDISSDGRTITYHLRRGVRWQDGVPLTARDIVFTARAEMNPANNVATRVGYEEVERIQAPDDYTVVVHLRRLFSPFVATFLGPQSVGAILPAHLLAAYNDLNHVPYNQHPIGSGPFRVVEWQHGDHVTLDANPLYWRGKPAIDRIVYRVIPDPVTRLQQLRTGESDAYFDIDPQLLPQVRTIPGITLKLTPIADIHMLRFNLRDSLLADVRVRRAIAQAIDRKRLLTAATHDSGIIVDGDQPSDGWAYDANVPHVRYDPKGSARLLEAAGWREQQGGLRYRNGRALELTLAIAPQGINGSPLVATVIQHDLRSVGIAVTIKTYTPAMLWQPAAAGGILASGRYQLAYDGWWVLGPDPDDTWNLACEQRPPRGENYDYWCDRGANDAMHDALHTFDVKRRARDYAVVQESLVNDLPEFTLWQVRKPDAYDRDLLGVAPSMAGSTFWNAWSWKIRRS